MGESFGTIGMRASIQSQQEDVVSRTAHVLASGHSSTIKSVLTAATSGWTILGAIGAGVGGIGAAVGGVAAWRAASASRTTSRDAMEALGLAIAPALTGEAGISPLRDGSDTGQWEARIHNVSTQYAAAKLHFEALFKDGATVKDELERLGPGETWTVQLRTIGMPPGGPAPQEAGRHAFLRFSDERRILRYQIEFGFLEAPRPDGSIRISVSMVPVSEAIRI